MIYNHNLCIYNLVLWVDKSLYWDHKNKPLCIESNTRSVGWHVLSIAGSWDRLWSIRHYSDDIHCCSKYSSHLGS